jgi:putative CocE/NonD family hydrolase
VSYHPASDGIDYAAFSIPSGTADRATEIMVETDLRATMRDGIELGCDVYRPVGATGLPTVMVRMPYGKSTAEMGMRQVGEWLAHKGYACIVQDVRGKFSSGGQFDPGIHEVDDGYDSVEWAVAQPWCSGAVGLFGESYYGFTSFAAAISGHPAIRAIAPGDIGLERQATWVRQGALLLNTTGYWALSMDASEYADVSRLDPFHLPIRDLPATIGLQGAFFRGVVDHAADPAWWLPRSLHHQIGQIRCAVLSWSGWYDNYVGPQLDDLARLMAVHPHPETVHLMIGPWDHEGSAGGADRAVCIPVPDTARHRWDTYEAFFDRYLRGEDNGFGAAGQADLFTIGRNTWRSSECWPPAEMQPTPIYLREGAHLSFDAPIGAEPPDRYVYDPSNVAGETVGKSCWALCTTLGDRRTLDDRTDVLHYTSEPLAQDLELTGPVVAELHAASSAVDTDFAVTLCHVLADGTVNTIQDGIVRARYRHGVDHAEALQPGAVERYEISLFATSYLVPAGDRLRVDVASSCFDRYDRNLNTGEPIGQGSRWVVAEQTIHHDAAHPSRVILPIAPPA